MKFYTPEQYILKAVGTYPTLYSNDTYDKVRYSVLDQIFNTIGNGIHDIKEFEYQDYDFEGAKKYITEESLFYGWHKDDCIFKFLNEGESFITYKQGAKSIDVLDSERVNHPEIGDWVKCTRTGIKNPYPNFQEEYSMVLDKEFTFSDLGSEWIKEAIWYYQESLKYFQDSESYKSYHYAFPKYDSYHKRDVTEKSLKDFQRHIAGKYASYEALSEAYGVEGYNGDDYDFLCRRWNQERARIIEFINETIKMLESKL